MRIFVVLFALLLLATTVDARPTVRFGALPGHVGGAYQWLPDGTDLVLYNAGTELLRIDSSGNVVAVGTIRAYALSAAVAPGAAGSIKGATVIASTRVQAADYTDAAGTGYMSMSQGGATAAGRGFAIGSTPSTTQPTLRMAQSSGATWPTGTDRSLQVLTTGFEIHRAGGLYGAMVVEKLGVNGAAPTYPGCVWKYIAWNDGSVYVDQVLTASGTPTEADQYLRTPDLYLIPGTGGLDGTFQGRLQGASGTGDVVVRTGLAGPTSTGVKLSRGWWTPVGFGGAVGVSSAASVPQTHALDLASATAAINPTGMYRIMQAGNTALHYIGGGYANANLGSVLAQGGVAIPAAKGVTFTKGSKPATPAAENIVVYAGNDGGIAVLSVEKSDATTHIVTIVP